MHGTARRCTCSRNLVLSRSELHGRASSLVSKMVSRPPYAQNYGMPQRPTGKVVPMPDGTLGSRPLTDSEFAEFEAEARRQLSVRITTSFRSESELHALGYRTALPLVDRRRILRTAVVQLGLRRVAQTIASVAAFRKSQRLGPVTYAEAIKRWESDLQWLRSAFLASHTDEFPDGYWPTTEPPSSETH